MLRKHKKPVKSDDILALGAILYEMAALYPSLTLMYRSDTKTLKQFPRLPKGHYSLEFKEIITWISQSDLQDRPKIDEVIAKLHEYAMKFNTEERPMLSALINEVEQKKVVKKEVDVSAIKVMPPPMKKRRESFV